MQAATCFCKTGLSIAGIGIAYGSDRGIRVVADDTTRTGNPVQSCIFSCR
jgi:hypothetical protein